MEQKISKDCHVFSMSMESASIPTYLLADIGKHIPASQGRTSEKDWGINHYVCVSLWGVQSASTTARKRVILVNGGFVYPSTGICTAVRTVQCTNDRKSLSHH